MGASGVFSFRSTPQSRKYPPTSEANQGNNRKERKRPNRKQKKNTQKAPTKNDQKEQNTHRKPEPTHTAKKRYNPYKTHKKEKRRRKEKKRAALHTIKTNTTKSQTKQKEKPKEKRKERKRAADKEKRKKKQQPLFIYHEYTFYPSVEFLLVSGYMTMMFRNTDRQLFVMIGYPFPLPHIFFESIRGATYLAKPHL